MALVTATVVARLSSASCRLLGQEGRGGRGGEGGQAQSRRKLGFFGSYRVAADKMDPSKLPIIGAWRINFDRSDPALKLAESLQGHRHQ